MHVSIDGVNRLQRVVLSLLGAGLVACSSDSRNEPSPAEMCQNLSTECAGFQSEELNACQQLGQEGLRDETQQDACYVYYDTCIDRCRFYAEFGEFLPDAGGDGGASTDGGAASDAGVETVLDSGQ